MIYCSRKTRAGAAKSKELLDLSFLEFDVLPHDRIVLVQLQFLCLGTGILLGHVELTGIRGGHELDLNGVRLCHDKSPGGRMTQVTRGRQVSLESKSTRRTPKPDFCAAKTWLTGCELRRHLAKLRQGKDKAGNAAKPTNHSEHVSLDRRLRDFVVFVYIFQ